ncbi:MAG: methyltransferase domain-containing protein [Betaproteobacteria bacterium]
MSDLAMLANFRGKPDRALSVFRYEGLAEGYDASCKHIGEIRTAAIQALQLTDGDIVFDVACGTGKTLCEMATKIGARGQAIGIEHSPEMAAIARQRVASLQRPDRVTLLQSAVEEVQLPGEASAILFCYTHDVLQSAAALENIFRHAANGARVAVVGNRLQSWWWAAPLNLWVCLRGWRYLTTFRGFRQPWRGLLTYCPELRVVETFHLGMSYLAVGRVVRHGDFQSLALARPAG